VAQRRVEGDTPTRTAIIDWDGTAVPAMWPERPTEFNPGFVEAMLRLHRAGWHLTIFSARLSPWDPWTSTRRPPEHAAAEIQYVRDMLDRRGLGFIDIWVKEGKPGGDVYVDDKAERYNGRPGSWAAVTDKILTRYMSGEPTFPRFDQEAAV
jgi:hypothetical protein